MSESSPDQFKTTLKTINEKYHIDGLAHDGEHHRIFLAHQSERKLAIHIPKDATQSSNWARLMRGLKHPGLPEYIEDFETVNGVVVVTEWIEGQSLACLLKQGCYRHTERFTTALLLQAARLLTYLHGLRPPLIHGNLGVGNWLLDDTDRLVLVGFSAASDDPRQAQGVTWDLATLAATALYLLTGLKLDQIPNCSQGLAIQKLQISPPLANILSQCLGEDLAARPSVADFASRLALLLKTGTAESKTDLETVSATGLPQAAAPVNSMPDRHEDGLQIDTISVPDADAEIRIDDTGNKRPETRSSRLDDLWQGMIDDPTSIEAHENLAEFAIDSKQHIEAATRYRAFEEAHPEHFEICKKYRQEIAMSAAARIIAATPKTAAPEALAELAKWGLVASSGGLLLAMVAQSWIIAILSGPVFAFSLWAKIKGRRGD